MHNWSKLKELWEKNKRPSSRAFQKILKDLGHDVDDGAIRKYMRKWKKEEYDSASKKAQQGNSEFGKNLWEFCKAESATRADITLTNPHVVSVDAKSPIGVAFIADQHLGSYYVDYDKAEADAKLVADTPNMYAIFGGDSIDNFIKLAISSAMLESTAPPAEQLKLLEYYLSMFKGKILAMVSGNHELWMKEMTSFDIYKHILKVVPTYEPFAAKIDLYVGLIEYKIMIRHKYRFNSSFNLTHTVKRMYDMCDYPFDIGVICHHHQATYEPFSKHGQTRWAVRTGTYKITDEFASKIGFPPPNNKIVPTAILYPDEKKIEMVGSIEAAAKLIK